MITILHDSIRIHDITLQMLYAVIPNEVIITVEGKI